MQPNHGLDELFGAREAYVEFTPDILEDVRFVSGGLSVPGGVFLQAFEPTSGTAAGWYEDGTVAVVDHAFGAGRTRLIGTMAGAGYGRNEDPGGGAFFAGCLAFGAKTQHVECSDPNVWARLHDGDGGRYLWVANPLRREVPVRVRLSEALDGFSAARPLWGEGGTIDGSSLDMSVEGRNVSILELV